MEPDIVTFDCYGTLIDWEEGIRGAFQRVIGPGGRGKVSDQMFQFYLEEEKRIEANPGYCTYREVLADAMRAAAKRTGWVLSEEKSRFLAEDLPRWKPFPDTNPALHRLSKKYGLGILSNIDNDLLAGTLKHVSSSFEIIVTAEDVRSYKPRPAHFEQARRLIGNDRRWVHVAASLYHDIEPAGKLGIRAVWVDREKQATATLPMAHRVGGLRELADWLEA